MTALDTTVVVRLILRDDHDQLARAHSLLVTEACSVSTTVLLETAWVLKTAGGLAGSQVADQLRQLLDLDTVSVSDEESVRAALDDVDVGMEVAGAFHRAFAGPARRLATFDRRFSDAAAGRPGLPIDLL